MTPHQYGASPCYAELTAVTLAGLAHILLEISVSEAVARWFSTGVALAFVTYLVWRARGGMVVLHAWGMRRDNFWRALRAQSVFGVGGATVMLVYAATQGSITVPWSFWLTLALYPIWGAAQSPRMNRIVWRGVRQALSFPLACLMGKTAPMSASCLSASSTTTWSGVFS